MKRQKIFIEFPYPVELTDSIEKKIYYTISSFCAKHSKELVGKKLFVSSCGSMPIYKEPEEPDFNDSILHVDIKEAPK